MSRSRSAGTKKNKHADISSKLPPRNNNNNSPHATEAAPDELNDDDSPKHITRMNNRTLPGPS